MALKGSVSIYKTKLKKEDWINPKIEVKKSGIHGKGMFTIAFIKMGETIIVWSGIWGVDYTDNAEDAKKEKLNGKLVIQWDDDLFSMEEKGHELGYFINHSCDPNTWMEDAFTVTARRNIEAGEEITIDYAMWEDDENCIPELEKCQCGSPLCRGRITGKDYKLPKLQERYGVHFTPLLNKRIKKLREMSI